MDELFQIIDKGGVIGLLIFIVASGARGWWIFGFLYKQILEERNDWRMLALRATKLSEEAATIVQKGTGK